METYRSGKMKIESIEASDQIINLIEETAVVAVTVSLKGTYDTIAINGVFRYIRVWKISNEILKVIAGSCIQLA